MTDSEEYGFLSPDEADAPGDEYDNLAAETVTLENARNESLDLTGWELADAAAHVYTFPSVTLAPGETVTIHTGSGTDTETDLYWGQGAPVWNNGGDRILVRDAVGDEILNATYDESGAISYHAGGGTHESGVSQRVFDAVAGGDGSLSRADVLAMVQAYVRGQTVNDVSINRDAVLTLVQYYVTL